MAFQLDLEIDGKAFPDRLLNISYSIHRNVDHFGKPAGLPVGGSINMTVESSKDNSLFAWILDPYKHQNGVIKFKQDGQNASMRELSWENGYITSFAESADAYSGSAMTISFTITAEKLKMGGETQDNKWPKNS